MRDGGDVEDRIRLGQRVIAGVVAERVFVAQRFAQVNGVFDDQVGGRQNSFNLANDFTARLLGRTNSCGRVFFYIHAPNHVFIFAKPLQRHAPENGALPIPIMMIPVGIDWKMV